MSQVVGNQPPDEITLSGRSGPVNNARVQPDERETVPLCVTRESIARDLRALVRIRDERRRSPSGWPGKKRRCVHNTRNVKLRGHGEHVSQPADVDVVEIASGLVPNAHERSEMSDRVAIGRGPVERVSVTNIAIDEGSAQSAEGCATGKDHRMVPTPRERARNCSSKIAGAAGQ